ncbi:DUF1203 domain-containing protein [Arenimonas donghaensis]|uniref:DUF1203 domain-containing protein n=1 Tax=Arenimonas donghaensis DSM 18148 = HO3-R19 TaxID=1121014 RepID=A0A087MFW2_9GAMM|nr:DUF1203 domain-containing protein [Arenimonas donghaensis]KFL35765.1 hypothetical protein N788_06890 [Arenimonas donghaensis DSM 18148 = HO3-R19]
MDIRIRGLEAAPFHALMQLPPEAQAEHLATMRTADSHPGFPCRVSLDDAQPGETVLLANFQHQDAATPFRASHAIYVRLAARQAYDAINTVPPALARRTLSLRAFTAGGWLVGATLTPGTDALDAARTLLARDEVAYLHAHYAAMGCYAAWLGRAA